MVLVTITSNGVFLVTFAPYFRILRCLDLSQVSPSSLKTAMSDIEHAFLLGCHADYRIIFFHQQCRDRRCVIESSYFIGLGKIKTRRERLKLALYLRDQKAQTFKQL